MSPVQAGSVRAVLIDAHGTLVELDPPAPRLRALLRDRLGVDVGERAAAAALAAEITYYRRHLHEGRDPESVGALRARCAQVLFDALLSGADEPRPWPSSAIDSDTMTRVLLDSLVFRCFDDVRPALAAWRRLGLRIVVASNWDASLPETLGHLGLLEAVDGVVSSAACGVAKPDAGLLRAALKVAGVLATEAVHVGDSVAEDVAGARAAGVQPLLLLRGGEPAPDGVVAIRALTDVVALLGARAPAAV